MKRLLAVTTFVLFPAVTGAFSVTPYLALLGLHGTFFVAESTRTGRGMIVVPIGPGGHFPC